MGLNDELKKEEKDVILDYVNYEHCVVKRKDGTIKVTTKQNFEKGILGDHKKNSYVGAKNKANNGHYMEIVASRGYKDNDVLFDEGTLVTGVRYDAFERGEVSLKKK